MDWTSSNRIGGSTLVQILRLVHAPYLVFGSAIALLSGLIVPFQSILFGVIFYAFTQFGSGAINGQELGELVQKYCLYLAVLATCTWLLESLLYIAWSVAGELVSCSARQQLFARLLEKDIIWLETQKHGSAALLPRLHSDIKDLQAALSDCFGNFVSFASTFFACLIISIYHSWDLTLVILSTIPVIAGVTTRLTKLAQRYNHDQYEKQCEAMKHVTCALRSIVTVKSCRAEAIEVSKYRNNAASASYCYIRNAAMIASQLGFARMCTLSMFAQGFWYGSLLVYWKSMHPGDIMTTFWATLMASQALTQILSQVPTLEKARIAAVRLARLLELPEDGEHSTRAILSPHECYGELEIKDVGLYYPARTNSPALRNISMRVQRGGLMFLVGKSGSGKTSIGQLLLRLHEPTHGQIFIDGHAIEHLDFGWLREHVTLAEQHTSLFDESIRTNIAYGAGITCRDIHQETMEAAEFAMLLNIHEFPKALETSVGPSGRLLSGGQRQRVALARARLRDSPILILDEFTGALDQQSRSLLMKRVRQWRQNKTTLIITHDTDHIRHDDCVYVLDEGRIIGSGIRRDVEADMPSYFRGPMASQPNVNESVGDRELLKIVRAQRPSPLSSELFTVPISSDERYLIGQNSIRKRASHHAEGPHASFPEATHDIDHQESGLLSLRPILATVWPCLDARARAFLIAAATCATIQASLTPIFSYTFSQLLFSFSSFGANGNRSDEASRSAVKIVVIALIDGLITFAFHLLIEYCAERWIETVRIKVFGNLMRQSLSFFGDTKNNPARFAESLDHHATVMRNILARYASIVFVAVLMVTIAVIWSFTICPKLTLAILATVPVIYGIMATNAAVCERWDTIYNNEEICIGTTLGESILNIRTVRCFRLEGIMAQKHTVVTKRVLRVGLQRAFHVGLTYGLSESSLIFVAAFCFWYGGRLVASSQYTTQDMMSCFTILLMSLSFVNFLATSIPDITSARDYASRLLALSKLPPAPHEHTGSIRISSIGTINLNNLSFRYPSNPFIPILHDISLTIPSRTSLAIVGPSGSGKSTLASLLLNLYPISSPHDASQPPPITFANQPLHALHTPTLRSLISYVPQTPTLIPGTVAENISYGLPSSSPLTSRQSITTAAHHAGISAFIESLENGYDTIIGDGGTGLSGGQIQRIAIARALVRQPEVLVLDEPTSALDGESAGVVRDLVRDLKRRGVTVVVVTHCREMMKAVDEVVVLEMGRIVGKGSYEVLERREGRKAWFNCSRLHSPS